MFHGATTLDGLADTYDSSITVTNNGATLSANGAVFDGVDDYLSLTPGWSFGGEISIDIYEKGKDKSQVIDRISGNNIFFGDKCFQGGNDHKIALKSDRYHHVDGWQETKDILEKFYC